MSTFSPPAAGIRKFQFDDFDMEDANGGAFVPLADEPPPAVFSAEELEAARLEAEAAGRSLAAREAAASLEADISNALAGLGEQMTALLEEQQRQGAFIAGEAVRLAGLIARRVLPAMAEANALTEIEALIAACLGERPEEPRLVIRLPDHLLDPVSARMERLVCETGFAGKPVLLADPKLGRCEACVEWANGGAEWNFERQLGELEHEAVKLSRHRRKPAANHAKEIRGEAPEQESQS